MEKVVCFGSTICMIDAYNDLDWSSEESNPVWRILKDEQ